MTNEEILKSQKIIKYQSYFVKAMDAAREDEAGKYEYRLGVLKECFNDTIWMAIRYAHGRNTYAPSMVRDAVKAFRSIFPEWELKQDHTLKPFSKDSTLDFKDDYLNDLFKNEKL